MIHLLALMMALQVAPITVQHIFKLVTLGAYSGNHIFRVDKGFVAQVADVVGGRTYPMDALQQVSSVWAEIATDTHPTWHKQLCL